MKRAVASVLAVLALSGCAAAPSPGPTVTVTVPVTVMPSPAPTVTITATATRASDSPVDAYDAWWFCRSEILRMMAGVRPPYDEIDLNDYDASFVTADSTGFRVQAIGVAGDSSVGTGWCEVRGTAAAPVLDNYMYPP